MEQDTAYEVLWQKKADETAEIVRVYGQTAQIILPQRIEGYTVTGIAPYCFSDKEVLPEKGQLHRTRYTAADNFKRTDEDVRTNPGFISDTDTGINTDFVSDPATGINQDMLQMVCGSQLEEIMFPESLEEIGSFAFYNCTGLQKIHLYGKEIKIGSDAFMNTGALREIVCHVRRGESCGIRQILQQISAGIRVRMQDAYGTYADLFYPEYYEAYDEIAPAHIFGRSIVGEGFRARQCIRDGKIDFASYDAIFPQACVEESEQTLLKMALCRLREPWELGKEAEERYQTYLTGHIRGAWMEAVRKRDILLLEFLCTKGLLAGQERVFCAAKAAEEDWSEGGAYLLRSGAKEKGRRHVDRYSFDDL